MLITVGDVVLRSLGSPIVGIYELVAFSGAVVIGFSIPFTSWVRGHIYVDFFVGKLPGGCRKIIHLLTRSLGIGVFGLAGWNLMKMAQDLRSPGRSPRRCSCRFTRWCTGSGWHAFWNLWSSWRHGESIQGQYE